MALPAKSIITVYRLRHGTKLLRRIQTVLVAVAMPTSQQQTSIIIKLPPQQKYKQQQQIPPQPHPTPHIPTHLLHLPTTTVQRQRQRRRRRHEIQLYTALCHQLVVRYNSRQTKIRIRIVPQRLRC